LCATADVLNLGAGTGKWIRHEAKRLGLERPLGIELNRGKVARAQEQGLPVYQADFTELDPHAFPAVKVVVFDNVLEHLPSLDAVEDAFTRACTIASHVVHVRHPSFEHEGYLAGLGLKQYWTDWPGVHTAHVRIAEFEAMAARHGVDRVTVQPLKRARSSDDPTILPASAPSGQHKRERGPGEYGVYDEAVHGPKPHVEFDRPLYFAYDIFFFVTGEGAPQLEYHADPETEVARPFLTWPGRPGARRGRRLPFRSGKRAPR
jgi:hypothetical protein